ncbi:uncharacterized protein MELLADRAFT_76196 [Melampsora larici-populina 98AG31]|uniref:Uncharacterized protein n=1 Tax=Melampsora larici-populina (strain 98AG31 / pathotype 3-4-7) TaxID=747676 RepID=F4SE85_MELLP|nr:uncharacterized protein MELLADRAFT_76196 [Melampsora larici-populina 98AG31]EGF97040.1 hypothetical protein MELLADRAFT_76196 [Melampsora larici-populina 98AG31]
MEAGPTPDAALSRRLTNIRHILLVLSGKGGVGKSSVSVQIALSLLHSRPGVRVGLLDIDLTGPSIPRMLGLQGRSVFQSNDGWIPVQVDLAKDLQANNEDAVASDGLLKCMSIGFLLKNPQDSVVWRGPKKNAMIRQFLVDVQWGELDWLIVDTPPGTSDEHISLLEQLAPALIARSSSDSPNARLPTLSSVLVTTPQAVSLADVSKELDFARKTGLTVIGLIENMSGYLCPHCKEIQHVFGGGGGEAFCAQVPIDVEFMKLMDQAMWTDPNKEPRDGSDVSQTQETQHVNWDLIRRYAEVPSSKILGQICKKITESWNIHKTNVQIRMVTSTKTSISNPQSTSCDTGNSE